MLVDGSLVLSSSLVLDESLLHGTGDGSTLVLLSFSPTVTVGQSGADVGVSAQKTCMLTDKERYSAVADRGKPTIQQRVSGE